MIATTSTDTKPNGLDRLHKIQATDPLQDALDALHAMPPAMEVLPTGGRNTRLDVRCDLVPFRAFLKVAEVMAEGARKYQPDNWRLVPPEVHLNHALNHIALQQLGDTAEDHAGHAVCRLMMWYEQLAAQVNHETQ